MENHRVYGRLVEGFDLMRDDDPADHIPASDEILDYEALEQEDENFEGWYYDEPEDG
jgi:hypothetical protein